MKVLLAGGGSGGHVTPLRAIAEELLADADKKLTITVITDKKFLPQSQDIFKGLPVELKVIAAGKLRRYHGKSALWHLTHLPTILSNLVDILKIGWGTLQSVFLVARLKPDVIFCKGGFVCVPVGLAARVYNIPLLIHDSDTHPGLTNRILARWARKIATGMPTEFYQYPPQRMVYTGIPANRRLSELSSAAAKKNLGLANSQLILVTGGGTGAKRLNQATVSIAAELLDEQPKLYLTLITGPGKAAAARRKHSELPKALQRRWLIEEFTDLTNYIAAADVIVSRAGASALQEFANAKKAVITVPSPYLTGGHQLKNAELFARYKAVQLLNETDLTAQPSHLKQAIMQLLNDESARTELANQLFTQFAKPEAATEIAQLIRDTGS